MVNSKNREILWLEEVDSTNRWLLDHASNYADGTVCATTNQTKGRGRLGRQWENASGKMLAMSILVKGLLPPYATQLAGWTVYKSLKQFGVDSSIKWPNDVVIDNKKVCGILCESTICGDEVSCVIGIGVNLSQTEEDFKALGLFYATSVALSTKKTLDPSLLCETIAETWQKIWEKANSQGFESFAKEIETCLVGLGSPVKVLDTKGTPIFEGIALGIHPTTGAFCVKGDKETKEFVAGEVSLRGLYGQE
ncbi:MAG: biotin--[acetyl-CoA-carboxylase] ligase [Clostridia bacterium]|nr:biotin--[acetyl-CoA-carboxylase] ligase [Clostridia bacterium]